MTYTLIDQARELADRANERPGVSGADIGALIMAIWAICDQLEAMVEES